MIVTDEMRKDLLWWVQNVKLQDNFFKDQVVKSVCIQMHQFLGWSSYLNNQLINGRRSVNERFTY